MDSPLGLVSFVARADNRLTTLLSLDRSPATRSAIQAETGIPRATLSRILADFRDRDLVTRAGHEYAAAPLGRLLAEELLALAERIEVIAELQTLAPWLPLGELGIDVPDLAEATVTLPTPVEPLAPVQRTAAVFADAAHVRGLCTTVVPELLEALRFEVLGRGVSVDVVASADAFSVLTADPGVTEVAEDLIASGQVDLAVSDGSLPILAIEADGTVLLEVADDDGAIRGLIETDTPAVSSWFASAFATCRQDAERVAPEMLSS